LTGLASTSTKKRSSVEMGGEGDLGVGAEAWGLAGRVGGRASFEEEAAGAEGRDLVWYGYEREEDAVNIGAW
jgi:hypothetical protein